MTASLKELWITQQDGILYLVIHFLLRSRWQILCRRAPHDSHQLYKIWVTKFDKALSVQLRGCAQFIWAISKLYRLPLGRMSSHQSSLQHTPRKERTCCRLDWALVSQIKCSISWFCLIWTLGWIRGIGQRSWRGWGVYCQQHLRMCRRLRHCCLEGSGLSHSHFPWLELGI